jgi:hypothetical protein
MNFDCDDCEECVNGNCVAKTCPPYQYCLRDGNGGCCCGSEVCSWTMPGIESMCPAAGIDDPYCSDATVGAICNWNITVVNTVTYVGSCGKTPVGPCVIAKPRLCRDECTPFYPFFCICSTTYFGASIPLGESEICITP